MTAPGCNLSIRDRRVAAALGAAVIAALLVLLATPSVAAETYDGEMNLYGYKITMGLIEPDQVTSVDWDFGDGSAVESVTITTDNPVGTVTHTYAAKGDYVVKATMHNEYVKDGQTVQGEKTLTYLYHILGYPVVTFDSMGGSDVASIEGTAVSYVAEKPADPTKDGVKFLGWFTDRECTKAFDWSVEVVKHITLYAGWAEDVYTVTYDMAGGQGTVSEQRVAAGKTVIAPSEPTKEGFAFDGWYLGDDEFDFSAAITGNITLTAHWKQVFTVTFDTDGGSAVQKQTVVKDGYAVAPDHPTKEGFEFAGWTLGNQKFVFSTPITSDITLIASWTIPEEGFTVTYQVDDGEKFTQTVAKGGKATAPQEPTREGFVFDGWYLDGNEFDFSAPITSDITLTAHWKDASGGSDGKGDAKGVLSFVWIVFALLAVISIVALVFSGILFLGAPAVLFAILAIVTLVLYGGL